VGGVNFTNTNATIETAIRNGGIVKEGSHALLLRGTNTYAGGTTINTGQVDAAVTLLVGLSDLWLARGWLVQGGVGSGPRRDS